MKEPLRELPAFGAAELLAMPILPADGANASGRTNARSVN